VPDGAGVRVDTYLQKNQTISPFYDSMQAKVIAWGEDRESARMRLLKALDETSLLGVVSNKSYLSQIIAHPVFAGGDFSTGFIGQNFPQEVVSAACPTERQIALAAVALYVDDANTLADEHGLTPEFLGWHSSHESPAEYKLRWRDNEFEVDVLAHAGREFKIHVGKMQLKIEVVRGSHSEMHYLIDGVVGRARIAHRGDAVWIDAEGGCWRLEDITLAPAQAEAAGSDGRLLAHSGGKIVAVHVEVGQKVAKGKTLAVLEAMKMEFQLTLPVDGVVEAVSVQPGQQVKNRQLLIQVMPSA
jgi:geranyl-CoA carboxylase alpha subunit